MNSSARTLLDKIWDLHAIPAPVEAHGAPAILVIDFMLLHEVTSVQAFHLLGTRGIPVVYKDRLAATLDHSIPTRKNRFEIFDDAARTQVQALRDICKEQEITLFDFDSGKQGIVHVVGPELGLTQPGMTIVCGDSHTSTHGAFGALAFGVGTSEVGHVLASGAILQRKPRSFRVEFTGKFQPGVFAKDAILKLISEIGISGANGYVIEYCGDAVRSMSMEERMTICNMSIECGARAGLISPDETTLSYIKERAYAPTIERWNAACGYWRSLATDEGAQFDREISINLSDLHPMVTWGTNPEQAIEITQNVPKITSLPETHRRVAEGALVYTKLSEDTPLAGTPIQWAFLGSCTNGRIEDLRLAAKILEGRKVHPTVTMYVVPGSEAVSEQAEREGLRRIFEDSGAEFRMPGCSMCLGMNDDKVPPGERCISTSNRNFIGRQGEGSITHLASPATVAASALKGQITSPVSFFRR
jgi:3-isopropylmalate/(R)-2-methylmalate dehydratase large subunit